MKRTLMITLNVIVEVPDPEEEPPDRLDTGSQIANGLVNVIEAYLGDLPTHLGWHSLELRYIDETGINAGRCGICGAWVTDREKPEPVRGLNPGATVNGQLLCDEHLPQNHPLRF